MGANHQGEIAALCAIAQPSFGIITNIGKAHLEGFGGPQGVIKAKSELYQYLRQNSGRAFVNADNALLVNLAGTMEVTTYGTGNMCQLSGRIIASEDHLVFAWKSKKDEVPLDQKEAVHSRSEERRVGKECRSRWSP